MGIAQRELTLDEMARQLPQPAAATAQAADAAPGQAAARVLAVARGVAQAGVA
jgi:hypothetical protein